MTRKIVLTGAGKTKELTRRQNEIITLLSKGWTLSGSMGPDGTYMIYGYEIGEVQHVVFKTIKALLDAGHIKRSVSLGAPVYTLTE